MRISDWSSDVCSSDLAGRRRMSILVGNGALYYLEEMERGADGAMTGFGFPEMLVGVYDRFTAGDHDGAADLFDAYMPFIRCEQFGRASCRERVCQYV